MGCGTSNKYEKVYTQVPKVRQYLGDFNALGISESDVGKLFRLFQAIDGDCSGSIEIIELLMFLDVERTRFTKRIFSMFDDDNSGEIDFREFVLSIWNYCTLGKTSLVVFAFDLYDQDKSGYVDIGEAQHIIKDVYGEKFNQNSHAKRVYHKLEELNNNLIDLATFQKFAEKHPALLYPAFEMQTRFQRKVIGNAFWATLVRARVEMFRDRYVPLQEILYTYADRYDVSGGKSIQYDGGNTADATDNNDFSDVAIPDEADAQELTPEQRQLEAARRWRMTGGSNSGVLPSFKRSNTTGHDIIPISRGNSRANIIPPPRAGHSRTSTRQSSFQKSESTGGAVQSQFPGSRRRSSSRANPVMPADAAAARRASHSKGGADDHTKPVLSGVNEITADGLVAAPKKRRASTVLPTAVAVGVSDAPIAAASRRASVSGTGRRSSLKSSAQAVMAAEGRRRAAGA